MSIFYLLRTQTDAPIHDFFLPNHSESSQQQLKFAY